jgi:hypothetical protein
MSTEDERTLEGLFDDSDAVEAVAEEFFEKEEVVEPVEKTTEVVSQGKAELGGLGFKIDFSSLNSLPGVVVGKTGIEVSRFPVERIKFTKGQKALVSILSSQVIVAKTHYDEDVGNFLCFGGACCEKDLARVRYVYPIVKYETDSKGKVVGRELKNMALVLGPDQYDTIRDIEDLKGDITGFDLLVTCSDEQFQKISIQEAGPARWHKIKGADRAVSEFWSENSKYILKSIAKKITPQDYAKAKSVDMTSGEEVDFDDVFN